MTPRRGLVCVVVAILCGCGSLDTPDLRVGAIAGEITGGTTSGYAYVLGEPNVGSSLGPDGSFTIPAVTAGVVRLVLYDGVDRAQVVEVPVRGAMRVEFRQDAAAMPRAGRITVAVGSVDTRPVAGATLEMTDAEGRTTRIRATKDAPNPLLLFPVPPGEWKLRASHQGHRNSERLVRIDAGTDQFLDLDLEVEEE